MQDKKQGMKKTMETKNKYESWKEEYNINNLDDWSHDEDASNVLFMMGYPKNEITVNFVSNRLKHLIRAVVNGQKITDQMPKGHPVIYLETYSDSDASLLKDLFR